MQYKSDDYAQRTMLIDLTTAIGLIIFAIAITYVANRGGHVRLQASGRFEPSSFCTSFIAMLCFQTKSTSTSPNLVFTQLFRYLEPTTRLFPDLIQLYPFCQFNQSQTPSSDSINLKHAQIRNNLSYHFNPRSW